MDGASRRLVDQRVRNQIIWQLEHLAQGDAYLRDWSASSYFNDFYDWMPLEDAEPLTSLSMTREEIAAVERVRTLMNEAVEDTPLMIEVDDLIRSGWPTRIADLAAQVLDQLMARGLLSMDVEDQPWSPPNRAPLNES